MTDQEHARAVYDAMNAFNLAASEAHRSGITVKIETSDTMMGQRLYCTLTRQIQPEQCP